MSSTAALNPPSARPLTTEDVAALLGYRQAATVLRLVREEGLPATRFNRRYFFNENDVRAWMAERGLIAHTAPAPRGVTTSLPVAPDATSTVDPTWVAAQVAKFSADDLRRAGELLLALSRANLQAGAA
ncbi:hypothetical protein A5630_11940 [Mycolicibacterium mucogenicum]|uniref:Helix-turn-helix domain-containing protein n=1 Tax=Mycolicibacterium mucogenicum TaxID=56689 RepID=A0A1A3HEZ9_MYCMU|nr:helix-turn-helix domain-containing protein [Mycolicibacterium mucogenicum]OBJ46171.1 hypothetical protein A5630_11940 [Mycolicibacterium mucogenicum]